MQCATSLQKLLNGVFVVMMTPQRSRTAVRCVTDGESGKSVGYVSRSGQDLAIAATVVTSREGYDRRRDDACAPSVDAHEKMTGSACIRGILVPAFWSEDRNAVC